MSARIVSTWRPILNAAQHGEREEKALEADARDHRSERVRTGWPATREGAVLERINA
jgi:hypothetical protein